METSTLFWSRMRQSWTKALRLFGLIAKGGGTPLIVGITIIAFSFGYNQLLAWLPDAFPLASVLAVMFTLFLTFQRIRTWITTTDLVFLLPLEPQMDRYFRASLLYTGAVKLCQFCILALILYPLYHAKLGTGGAYTLVVILLGSALLFNLLLEWQSLRLTVSIEPGLLRIGKVFCGGLNLFLSYAALESCWWLAILALAALGFGYYYRTRIVPRAPYPWERLSRLEQETVAKYFTIANWFIDVPKFKRPIYERNWLIRLIDPFIQRDSIYPYLFWRTLIRRSDLLSVYLRLLAWVLLLSLCAPHPAVVIILTLLGNWMFITQWKNIGDEVHYPILYRLLPRPASERIGAIREIAFLLAFLFIFLIALVSLLVGWLNVAELILFLTVNSAFALWINRRKK